MNKKDGKGGKEKEKGGEKEKAPALDSIQRLAYKGNHNLGIHKPSGQ